MEYGLFLILIQSFLLTWEDSDKCHFSRYPWKCLLAFLWSLEVISKCCHGFCRHGYVPQVMGSALLSQIVPASGGNCSYRTAQYTHSHPATQTRRSAVATATKRTYKGLVELCPHKTDFMSRALDIMSIAQCLFTGAMLNFVICTLLFAHIT